MDFIGKNIIKINYIRTKTVNAVKFTVDPKILKQLNNKNYNDDEEVCGVCSA
jgi:hypothetical protein